MTKQEVSESIALTNADGVTVYLQAHQIEWVKTVSIGTINSKVKAWIGNGQSTTYLATQSRATIASAAGCLVEITPSGGSAYHVAINQIASYVTDGGTGSVIEFKQGGAMPASITVSESPSALATAINASSPAGNFVTTNTSQTVTAQKTWSSTQTYSMPLVVAGAGTVSAAGANQGAATAISAQTNLVTSGTDLQGVRLPAGPSTGSNVISITNGIGATPPINIYIYPATGGSIGSLSANAPVALPTGMTATFIATSATTWEVFYTTYSVATHSGLTAFAGGGQANATQLKGMLNTVTTVAAGGNSVKVRPIAQYPCGSDVLILNGGANAMNVFPATGENIGFGVNAAASIPAGKTLWLKKIAETTWYPVSSI